MTQRTLPVPLKLAYACGQAGNVLSYQVISVFVARLYLPPDGSGEAALVPALIAGIGTFLFLNVLARGVDSFFDPWIANVSDRSTSRFGRRRFFMLIGALPLAGATTLLFFPPTRDATFANVAFLAVVMTAYFCLFSTYVAPYLALLPELAPDPKDKTVVSTMMGAAALLGGLIATVVAPLLMLPASGDQHDAIQRMSVALGVVTFVLLAIPVLVVDERKLVERNEGEAASHAGFVDSLKATFRFRPFLPYVFGTNLFFFGFTVIQTAAPNVVEVLLRRPLSDVGAVMTPLFAVSAVSFPIVAWLANKHFGRRKMMIGAALLFAALAGAGIPALPSAPGLALPLFAVIGVAVSAFLALPNAMLADVAAANAAETGERREAMFFGAQGFLQKIALGVAAGGVYWIAPVFGMSPDRPLGVQLSGPLAAVALLGSAVCFWFYPEAKVTEQVERASAAGG